MHRNIKIYSFILSAIVSSAFAQGSGNAIDFDGSNDKVTINGLPHSNSVTVMAWVMYRNSPNGTDSNHGIVHMHPPGSAVGPESKTISIWVHGSGKIGGRIIQSDGAQKDFPLNQSLVKNKWHHVAVTVDENSGTAVQYVNGINVGSIAYAGSLQSWNDGMIGRQEPETWDGRIDEVSLWNRALTESEIRFNMCNKLEGTEAGLTGYWRMDESSGTTVFDATPNGHHGTMINMDPDVDHVRSSAPSGNESFYQYNPPTSLNLSHPNGDNLTIDAIAGNPDGVHIYRVSQAPYVTLPPIGFVVIDPLRYWGVFLIGGTDPTCNVTYNYSGHPGITDESALKLAKRADSASLDWLDASATLDIEANTLTAPSQSNGEYILGSSINQPLRDLPPDEIFTDIQAPLPGVAWSSAAWGDYDNDNDLDVLLTGNTGSGYVSKIYRNDSGTFVDISAPLLGVWESSVAWGDYDNDGDLDILLTGNASTTESRAPIALAYRNDAGSFAEIALPLLGLYRSFVAWGDFDNDGDLDALVTGLGNAGIVTKICRNDNGGFTDISAPLIGVHYGSVAWGDFDNDRDLDILLIGETSTSGGRKVAKIYQNEAETFLNFVNSLQGASHGVAEWGDFDSDGSLDILFCAGIDQGNSARVYRNIRGNFVDIFSPLTNAFYGSAGWVDFDNDGDFDILQTGETDGGRITKVYSNNDGSYVDTNASLTGVYTSSASWGDYDGDGDLDILLTGQPTSGGPITKIYRNNSSAANIAPTSPASLVSSTAQNTVTLSWIKATDNETPPNGLTYNLRVGTTPDGTQIVSPMADVNTGFRKVPKLGNTNHNTSWIIRNLAPGTYYWSVQAIDNAFAGSPFAPEQSFVILGTGDTTPPAAPQNLTAIAGDQQITLNWQANSEPDFLRYRIYGGTSPNPTSKVDSVNGAANTTKIIAGLTNGTTYYFRITAVDNSLNESGFSNEVNATPSAADMPPAVPQNLTATAGDQQITLNWQANNEADFLRYRIYGGTSSNPATKIDSVNGAANTTKIITGLTNGTRYYFRLTAVDNDLNQSGFSSEVNATPVAADLPPAAPQNLQATPGPAHGQITLTWETNAETDLLRYRIYGRKSTAPAALLDSVAATASTRRTFSNLAIGSTYAYFLTAVDMRGQASAASNQASATPLRDTQAPFIDMPTYSIFVDLNTDAPVRVRVTDLSQLTSVHIFYRTGGDASFLNKQMILQTDGTYFRNVPSTVMTTRGAEFYFTARDVHGNVATSKRYPLRVICANGLVSPNVQPRGTSVADFRIFSVPLDLDDKSPQAFVMANPLLEPPDATQYRWYACDRSTGTLKEYPNFSNITLAPDMGFPLLVNLKNFRLKTGSGKTMSISNVHQVALPAGWSLIGNPFNFAIPYDSLRVSDGATFELWSFNGDWQINRAGLEPWQGYAIRLNRAATLFISPGVAGLSEGVAVHAVANNEGENWLLQIIASNGRSESRFNFAGQHADAAGEVDAWDLHQPPRLADQVQVQFQPKQIAGGLKADVRQPSVEGHTWEFTCIVNPADELLRLAFEGVQHIPAGFEIFLVDEETETGYDLRSNNHLEFAIRNLIEKKFKLLAGNKSYVTTQAREVELDPQSYVLLQNFPNPFNPATQIIYALPEAGMVELSVYNVHGQLVARLVNEPQSAGSHTAVWQARGAGSGVYWIRLQAGKVRVLRKCLLIK